ncbi:glycosyltransferase involved in cell wall biosynthesis [Kineosphaera limosa]|uniref:Putative glycosyltransferase n=1 Tax=Kineosphaera limosa NBRC 100340 TaxID=1184609 RepID=K6WWR0_9MICO|nr:glycosyltransferase family 4 protein [Kineosphaera limosa]NYE00419.1 glycosyltransferase involved in cell wall biosynthesis [Kineosphaera limosa]GAB98261.1 putative glycosyltransferase [Kineosphaera limosa NBRC 100340]
MDAETTLDVPRLRIALLSYRSKPHCGGQGVYVRHLSRELAALGHEVTVFSGQPYPVLDRLDAGVTLRPVPSLDLYREPDPFRLPRPREYRDAIDVLEVATMLTAGFPEPRTFSLRAARALRAAADAGAEFDVVHDNQTLGDGMLRIQRDWPLVTTIHHPISQDRRTDLAAARGWRRLTLRRWYGFVRMQARVARQLQHVLTVSRSSARDIAIDFGVDPAALTVVPLGVETDVFTPQAHPGPRVEGRVVAMASADTPLKGIDTLLRAVALAPQVQEVVLVATPGETTRRLIAELGVGERVRFVSGLADAELAALLASAQVACVPSRYEGFSLPAVEMMACGTAIVASRAGALPEVLGDDGSCAQLVPPGDVEALRAALVALLADPARRAAMGTAGRQRALARYSWPAVARATVAAYRRAMAQHPNGPGPTDSGRPADQPARDERKPLRAHR